MKNLIPTDITFNNAPAVSLRPAFGDMARMHFGRTNTHSLLTYIGKIFNQIFVTTKKDTLIST
jgi:hypothetical protein